MQKKSTSCSGFFTSRTLLTLFVCAASCSILTAALLRSAGDRELARRTLTFGQRVAYQRAIEEISWSHRIWPKERPDAKPSLEAVMSQEQLEKKVTDYLRKSQALEDYWQRPITAEQLQAEMERMAKNTKQPEVLRELFEALGNDPFVIAECLARPALAERLLTNWYAHDERIHGVLKQRANAELQADPSIDQIKHLSDTYSEIEFVKSDSGETVGLARYLPTRQSTGGAPAAQQQDFSHTLTLNSRQWSKTMQKLAATFSDRAKAQPTNNSAACADEIVPTGKVSPLQEDASGYYALAVLEKSDNRLTLATMVWLKEPSRSWLEKPVLTIPEGPLPLQIIILFPVHTAQ